MKKQYIFCLSVFLLVLGCSDDFLEKLPKDQLAEVTTFTSDANFETYAWGFYDNFSAYELDFLNSEWNGDLGLKNNSAIGSEWLWQRKIVPSADKSWTSPYWNIKRVNLMLDNIDNGQLSDIEKEHWTSVGYFFRSYEYFKLLKKYGAVPWIDRVLTDADVDILFGPKNTRDEVAKNILDDLKWAEEHIKPAGNGANTINTNVVRALISQFGLFEGTWRKYHDLGGEQPYLQASADASELLMASFPVLEENYDNVFNSASLNTVKGIILYKAYEFGQLVHVLNSRHRNSAGNWDLTKKAADMYLCSDGETVWTSEQFDGHEDPYDEFRNRDHRMYYTIVPPFRVVPTGNKLDWNYHSDTKHREYIDLMNGLSDYEHKTLPTMNWRGLIVKTAPHYRKFNEGQGFNVTATGYKEYKFYNALARIQNQDYADAPIFRIGETMMNYAEAKYELGEFDQAVADMTINKLRVRGNIAPMDVNNVIEDPKRDATVAPLLWEIRRERAIELMAEGYRFDDLRRWRKLHEYGAKEKLGMYVEGANYGNRLPIQGGADEGYVSPFGVPPGVPEHYYLYPIPSDQIVLNTKLKQNPVWNTSTEE